MSKNRLVIFLMAVVAVIIVSLTVFVLTHLSGINLAQGIILIAAAVVGLLLVMIIIIILLRSVNAGTKK